MNRVWSIEYGVSGLVPIQVAGGGPGWQVAGGSNAQGGIGDREDAAGDEILQVTGDGHQGIGPSGVGPSAVGHRLRVPAAGSRAAGS